jgi:hypothetical protein
VRYNAVYLNPAGDQPAMRDTLIALPVLVAGTLLKILGQAAPTMDPGIGTLVGNLGIMGVLVWHLWYHTTHSYPKMLERFTAEQDAQRKLFLTEQSEQRSLFAKEQADARAFTARETGELRAMLIQNLQAMRTAVHDVRDTAQTAMLKKAADSQ